MSSGNNKLSSLPITPLILLSLVLVSSMLISIEARPLTQTGTTKRSSSTTAESKKEHTKTSGYRDVEADAAVKKSGPSPGEGH